MKFEFELDNVNIITIIVSMLTLIFVYLLNAASLYAIWKLTGLLTFSWMNVLYLTIIWIPVHLIFNHPIFNINEKD